MSACVFYPTLPFRLDENLLYIVAVVLDLFILWPLNVADCDKASIMSEKHRILFTPNKTGDPFVHVLNN